MTDRSVEVVHDEDAGRYRLLVDGRDVGVADYRLAGTTDAPVAVFHHTFVDPAERGAGMAAQLVAGALDDVRGRGLEVVATCWYVDRYLDEHPEHADLRA